MHRKSWRGALRIRTHDPGDVDNLQNANSGISGRQSKQGERPGSRSARPGDLQGTAGSTEQVSAAASNREPPNEPGGICSLEEAAEEVPYQELLQIAIKMFCGGRDELVVFANIFVASRRLEKVTLAPVSTIKAVVTSLFKDHDERLCSSPERPDLRLSQEEAMGYLAGILVVGQLLPDEGRPVGKRLDSRACQEKKTKEKRRREKARQRKKDLRRKKGASEDIENKCEAIDEAV